SPALVKTIRQRPGHRFNPSFPSPCYAKRQGWANQAAEAQRSRSLSPQRPSMPGSTSPSLSPNYVRSQDNSPVEVNKRPPRVPERQRHNPYRVPDAPSRREAPKYTPPRRGGRQDENVGNQVERSRDRGLKPYPLQRRVDDRGRENVRVPRPSHLPQRKPVRSISHGRQYGPSRAPMRGYHHQKHQRLVVQHGDRERERDAYSKEALQETLSVRQAQAPQGYQRGRGGRDRDSAAAAGLNPSRYDRRPAQPKYSRVAGIVNARY
ncbi:hypothetical protein KIPB_011871, partial [Kipferlia bialata]